MRAEQRFADLVGIAFAPGQPDQAMRLERVDAHLAAVEVERQAFGATGGLGLREDLLGALARRRTCVS